MKVKVILKDNNVYEIEKDLLSKSGYFKDLFNSYPDEVEFPLTSDYNAKLFGYVVEWLERHKENKAFIPESPLKCHDFKIVVGEWEETFFNKIFDNKYENLLEFINMTNNLDLKDCWNQACCKLACLTEDFNAEQIMKLYNLDENCTEEDLDKIEKECLEDKIKEISLEREKENLNKKNYNDLNNIDINQLNKKDKDNEKIIEKEKESK